MLLDDKVWLPEPGSKFRAFSLPFYLNAESLNFVVAFFKQAPELTKDPKELPFIK